MNLLLVMAGLSSFIAALLHVGIIFGGAGWYRTFGAGERLAELAEQGSKIPTLVTSAIAAALALLGFYALAGAGLFIALPMTRSVLLLAAFVFLLRGGLLVPALFWPGMKGLGYVSRSFWVWSSLISLMIGFFFAAGTMEAGASL